MLGIISDMMTTAVFFDRRSRKAQSERGATRRVAESRISAKRNQDNALRNMPSPFLDLKPRSKR